MWILLKNEINKSFQSEIAEGLMVSGKLTFTLLE